MRPLSLSRLETGLIPFFSRLFAQPAAPPAPAPARRSRVSVALEAAARARQS